MLKFCFAALVLLSSTILTAQESPRVSCEVSMFRTFNAKESEELKKLPEEELAKRTEGRSTLLGKFNPDIGEEVETVKTFGIPGKERLNVSGSFFFTDEEFPGDSTRLVLYVGKSESKDPAFEVDNATARSSQFWIDIPVSDEQLRSLGFVDTPAVISVAKNIRVDGVVHLVVAECVRPRGK